ncbi:DUF4230 domain-containing protein [Clostridium sp. MB40-C1]|uniref:DUF4230 domain-containing protein n=1 Tax=Clostridium sp. MB40-C1 TaxID=3070996 RepID=UPI0027E157BF|nr:DUF4230 domain-containing protein [Clostridium sp. MB40-C1]WMJ79649.1 DUF4230 domain-containing protein [Clostridium sp. MB40-C1]
MKKWYKYIKFIFLAVIIISLTWILAGFSTKQDKVVDRSNVTNEFKNISELATYKNSYTDVLFIKDSKKIKEFTIPFTTNSILIKYSGYIKAGVDLQSAQIDLDESEKKITVKLKKSKILDNVIDTNSVTVLDETTSIFSNVQTKEIFDEINNNKGQVVDKLVKEGFLDKANENTKILLKGLLKNMGFEKISIEFV